MPSIGLSPRERGRNGSSMTPLDDFLTPAQIPATPTKKTRGLGFFKGKLGIFQTPDRSQQQQHIFRLSFTPPPRLGHGGGEPCRDRTRLEDVTEDEDFEKVASDAEDEEEEDSFVNWDHFTDVSPFDGVSMKRGGLMDIDEDLISPCTVIQVPHNSPDSISDTPSRCSKTDSDGSSPSHLGSLQDSYGLSDSSGSSAQSNSNSTVNAPANLTPVFEKMAAAAGADLYPIDWRRPFFANLDPDIFVAPHPELVQIPNQDPNLRKFTSKPRSSKAVNDDEMAEVQCGDEEWSVVSMQYGNVNVDESRVVKRRKVVPKSAAPDLDQVNQKLQQLKVHPLYMAKHRDDPNWAFFGPPGR